MNATPENDNARGQAGEVGKVKACDSAIVTDLIDTIKATLMAGESITPTDIPQEHRVLFWAALQRVRDEIPVRVIWRTVQEQHVDGLRLREKRFRLRVRGSLDPALAGWLCVAAVSLLVAARGVLA